MMARNLPSWFSSLLFITSILSICNPASAASSSDTTYVEYTNEDGQTVYLADDRRPALYTQNFGDCQGDSLINVTRFDAAYYKDNMTVLFHLEGNSALTNQSLMRMLFLSPHCEPKLIFHLVYIGVFAYGEQRFELTFNPCSANINSLCPLNSSIPIQAAGIIPVSQENVGGFPSIALSIPDFEGQAILRIFANSTESQIACYSAVVTNGASFSHPAEVGTILGIFAAIALVSSIAVAIYGESVPEIRRHYAHSISVFVVFSVLQHIFFTGALSMNWPSVLVAFWSNYAWAGGMIYNTHMQNSINKFIGSNRGNISEVGAAQSGVNAVGLDGGYQISQIYKRATSVSLEAYDHALSKRAIADSSNGFSWYGHPVLPGLPLPGNYSGFAGTLAQENIPASNAFLTGLLWLLILTVCLAAGIVALKWILEALALVHVIKTHRLTHFRTNWLVFTGAVVLRTLFIAFFAIIFLTTFQFTLGGSTGVKAIAGVTLALFLIGTLGSAAYALLYRLRSGKYVSRPDRLNIEKKKLGFIPYYSLVRESKIFLGSIPWWGMRPADSEAAAVPVHDDADYNRKFGWLSARFRQSKWWFFSFWVVYELVRACFYGGAAGHALIQVFGLLVVEAIALFAIVFMKPFESNRLNVLMVYMLGFSKVATVALSSAFDARFGLPRITTTVIGIVIIVIQGFLTIALMVLIILGAISSYMSILRNKETESFRPRRWRSYRTRYFAHVDQKATDKPAPRPPTPEPVPTPSVPSEPYFKVASVRRAPKIEDDDEDNQIDDVDDSTAVNAPTTENSTNPYSRTLSLSSRTSVSNLPYGARRHRASWSSRDFSQLYGEAAEHGTPSRMSIDSLGDASTRPRATSQRLPSRAGPQDRQNEARRKRRDTNDLENSRRNSADLAEEVEVE